MKADTKDSTLRQIPYRIFLLTVILLKLKSLGANGSVNSTLAIQHQPPKLITSP